MVSHQQNSTFFLDALSCDEQKLIWEDEELNSLLKKEQENQVCRSSTTALEENQGRGEAIEWMLKVTAYYSFSALTAVLAVNYLDRFLCSFQSHPHKPWITHLAAVASLSLAAKLDETQVPLLLDLQVEESKYVFEPKTIQRMEILVLSTLKWKMNPVTPLSFLDYIAKGLALNNNLCTEFLTRCQRLILSVISDSRFMRCAPSALATATMLYVITSIEPCIGLKYHDQLVGILGINKEKVHDCCVLIEEVATSVNFYSTNKRKYGSLGCSSPKGVFDASFSSNSSNDSSSPLSLSKKIKSQTPENVRFSEF